MKIQRRLPKSMRKNPCERAMPLWTSEPESTEWFDTFNLDGEELIGLEPEPQPQPSKEDIKMAEKKKQDKKAAKKGEKRAEQPKPTVNGYVVLDGNHHTIAVGTPASYEVLFDEELKVHAKKDGSEQAQKRQQKAEQNRTHHLHLVAEQMRNSFVAKTGELLIAELVVAGPGNMKAGLMKVLPAPLAKVATSDGHQPVRQVRPVGAGAGDAPGGAQSREGEAGTQGQEGRARQAGGELSAPEAGRQAEAGKQAEETARHAQEGAGQEGQEALQLMIRRRGCSLVS
ncbi:uncharacterized protein LOC122246617 [Penaeus japonicus]|uniref:uncharacterized protein LOC122246617 n=1 Tax=Penaeus japonicus TaxID=27405 RepID=UPI001C70E47E|nr:uncharacterized protein LOC122246617 [Penaeus japonicus]